MTTSGALYAVFHPIPRLTVLPTGMHVGHRILYMLTKVVKFESLHLVLQSMGHAKFVVNYTGNLVESRNENDNHDFEVSGLAILSRETILGPSDWSPVSIRL